MRALAACAVIGLLAVSGPAAADPTGARCSFLPDPTDLRSDVAAFVVSGGPLLAEDPGATSVTVTCWVLTDGSRAASVSMTRSGSVGYVTGRTSVGTFTAPTLTHCTEVSWAGAAPGSWSDCSDAA